MSIRTRKLMRWLLGSLLALVLVAGVLLGAFGYVVARVPEYRVQLQDWINERSGLAVEFRTLRARLRLYGPELIFVDAVVRTPDRTRVLATAKRGIVGLDIWSSITTGHLKAGRFALVSPEIGLIRTREGRIQLLGQSALPEGSKPFALEQLPTGHFRVRNAVVSFRDEITGRGPWSLSGVNFELVRDSDSLELRGDAALPEALGSELRFSASASGPLQQYESLVSTFSVEGERLDLAGWADVFPDEWPSPETGHGAMRVSGALRGPALTQLSAKIDLANVAAVLPVWAEPLPVAQPMERPDQPDESGSKEAELTETALTETGPTAPEVLSYDRIALEFRAQQVHGAWNAVISDLDLARKNSAWRAGEISASWSRGAEGELKVSGKADRIVLENLWPLLAYLPESPQLARLRALDARGAIENLALEYQRAAPEAAAKYKLQAQVADLAIKPVARSPGFAGLGGRVNATEQGGTWQLAGAQAAFDLPRMFRKPLAVSSLGGTIEWQHTGAGWKIHSDEVRLSGADGSAVARFAATVPADGSSPLLDLSAHGKNLQVSATSKYIPAAKRGAKTMEWFDRAFVAGNVTDAQLILNGPVQAFPFRNDEGTFNVRGTVENAVFDYQEGYTPAREVAALVEFHNQGMHIEASSAKVGELQVAKATADIADLRETRLIIKAAAKGDVRHGLQFLRSSPLGPKLGGLFARLNGQGPMSADVSLDLPLKRIANRDIEVRARFNNAQMSMQGIDPTVRALTGTLKVKNTLIAAADLEGQWLEGPLTVFIEPQGRLESIVDVRGRASAAQLKPLLKLPSTVDLTGSTDWHLTTVLTGDDSERARTVRIDSDLRGLGIRLPAPVGKQESEARSLQLTLELDGDDALLARGALGDVRSLILVRQDARGWALDRGGLRTDGVAPGLPDHRGLRIEGSLDRFVLDDWLALRTSGAGGKPLSEYLRAANVRIGTFELFGYAWSDVRGMLQATPAGWRVDVTGPNAAGQILIPESFTGAQPLRATLEHLVVQSASQEEGREDAAEKEDRPMDPRNLPSMQIYISDLHLGSRAIGTVDLKASRVPQGLRFDSATVTSPSVRAEGSGRWLTTTDGPQSSLNATVTSSDVAATLRALNYTEFVQAKHGSIRANLSWPGGFDGNILEHASGAITVEAEAGQLVNLQPGAGRVLGLFSVAALPRRLALDFSDLTDKGLAFDTVHGDFELRDGNAYTNNLLLRGPAAEIGIAGRTGLGTRDYDQTAIVTGNLGASLPVAGVLAAGPTVGAALLLFSQVFKEPLKGITRGYYRITGPWDDPVVERVDASQVKVGRVGN